VQGYNTIMGVFLYYILKLKIYMCNAVTIRSICYLRLPIVQGYNTIMGGFLYYIIIETQDIYVMLSLLGQY